MKVGMINANRVMRVQSGMVVGVPIAPADELNSQHIESAIKQALVEANDRNLAGKGIKIVFTISNCLHNFRYHTLPTREG